MGKGKRKKRKGWYFIIPAIIIGICAGVFYTPLYAEIDKKLFGLLDYIRPPASAEQKIIHLTIEKPYPSRELLGKGIMALQELGAHTITAAADLGEMPDGAGGDAYLGGALDAAGNAYIPIFVEDEGSGGTPGEAAIVEELFSLRDAEIREDFPFAFEGYRAPSLPLLSGAGRGGFLYSGKAADKDGRKMPFVRKYEDTYYPHLIFAAVLGWMQDPSIFLFRDRIVLQNAAVPGREMKNVVVPFSESGDVYVRGPVPPSYSFRPYIRHEENLEELYLIIERLDEKNLLTEETGGMELTEIYNSAETLRRRLIRGETADEKKNIKALRERFLREAGAFFTGDSELIIMESLGDAEEAGLEAERTEIEEMFITGRRLYKQITDRREELANTAKNAFCILTYEELPETVVRKYAAAVHSLVSENFIDDFPWWYSLAAAALLAFLLLYVLTRMRPLLAVAVGLPAAAVFAGLPLISFHFFSIYLPLFFPAAAAAAAYLAAVAVQISSFTREKRDIRIRFFSSVPASRMSDVTEMYSAAAEMDGIRLPVAVLHVKIGNQPVILQENPPADIIKMYSSFSEMFRDTVLSFEGLIGSVGTGTAWGVWGAFSEDSSDALVACRAALAMQKRLQDEELPFYLTFSLTSGDGVRAKKVTLADTAIPVAGVPVVQGEKILQAHAMYGAPIIVSGKVHNETAASFLFRRLDRIRIEGFPDAVRLYELMGTPETADEKTRAFLELYSRAHSLFEKQEWKQAHKLFIEALQKKENDKTAALYARRCQKFVKEPPSASWDGTFSVF